MSNGTEKSQKQETNEIEISRAHGIKFPMDDDNYEPYTKKKATKPKKNDQVKKTLTQLAPQIKKMAKEGLQPAEITAILNQDLPAKDRLLPKQISNKISRMKSTSDIKNLNVAKTSGSLKAANGDGMILFCFFVLLLNFPHKFFFFHQFILIMLASWQRIASNMAKQNEGEESEGDEEESFEESKEKFGEDFLRYRTHSTNTHFYIIAETCVNRLWSTKINDDDDTIVELTATLKQPDFDVIDQLFPGHRVDFGFEEDAEPDTFTFSLETGKKIARKDPVASSSPNEVTPLWYGFMYDFAETLVEISAQNVDFSDILKKNNLKRPAEEESSEEHAPEKKKAKKKKGKK